MSNPVLSHVKAFTEPSQVAAPQAGPVGPAPSGYYAAGQQAPAYPTMTPEQLQQAYAAPSATAVQAGKLTYDDVILTTGGLFAVLLVTGTLTWVIYPPAMIVGFIGGLVFGLINAFRREPSKPLILAYAACEGVALGGLSAVMNEVFPGIVLQAVLATAGVFAVMLFLHASNIIRATPKMVRFLLMAMIGYLVFMGLNWLLTLTGMIDQSMLSMTLPENPDIPIGLLVSIGVTLLASFCLLIDFEQIRQGVEGGVPRKYAWTAAFGLMVTVVWLYVEILRLLSYLRD